VQKFLSAVILVFFCAALSAAQDAADFLVKDRVLLNYRGMERDVVIPPRLGIDRIGARAFAGKYISSVTIPMGVGHIDERAFMGCSFLKTVTLPNTLMVLGRRAFFNCRGLKKIDLPDTLKSLGSRAFSGCTGLEELSLSRRTKLGDRPFMGIRCEITWKD
jgi:hypothetical protein